MDVLLIFVSLLLPCKSYLEDYLPRRNKLRLQFTTPFHNVMSREGDVTREDDSDRSIYPSYSKWLRQKKNKVKKYVIPTYLPSHPTLNKTIFNIIRDEVNNAAPITTDRYPWIARVVHSPDRKVPYLCTAACIEERIFITAARCVYQAKVLLTTVIYQTDTLHPIAIVTPSKPTNQMFDDIGFIIVDTSHHGWTTIKLFDVTDNTKFKRTDEHFYWLARLGVLNGTAIGYVIHDERRPETLYEIKVHISPFLCQHFYNTDILNQTYRSDNFFVPCYHTCTLEEGYTVEKKCYNRLAGEGHVIIEEDTGKLIGIATWAGYFGKNIDRTLPVGMAVPNSDSFQEDLQCALKIRDAPVTSPTFTNLC